MPYKLIILVVSIGAFALYRRATGWHIVYLMAIVTGAVSEIGFTRLLPQKAQELIFDWLTDAPYLLLGMIAYALLYKLVPILAIYWFGRIDDRSPRIHTGLGLWVGLAYAAASIFVGQPPAEVTRTWITWINWATVPLFYIVSIGVTGLALYFRLRLAIPLILTLLIIDVMVFDGMYFETSNSALREHAAFRLFVSVAATVYLPMLVRHLQQRHEKSTALQYSLGEAAGESVA